MMLSFFSKMLDSSLLGNELPSVQQTRAMAVMFFCDASHEISAKIMVKTRLSHLLAAIGLFGLKIVKRQKVFCQIASGPCKVICFNAI